MKKLSIFLTIALMAIIYSCGNSEKGSNEQTSTEKQEKDGLYKYFSKEEIQKDMDNAMNILTTVDEGMRDSNILAYEDLFTKEGFAVSPKELEKKWGKANSQKDETIKMKLKEGIYELKYSELEFKQFKIVLTDNDDYGWGINSFETSTPGFGIGGIYVGIPECNKEYLLKLFEKFEVRENSYEGNEYLLITLTDEFDRGLKIDLDENNLVKSISYTAYYL